MNFYVEGPDWEQSVSIDPELFENERDQLIEAGTLAIEKQIRATPSKEGGTLGAEKKTLTIQDTEVFNLGAILLVKKSKTAKKEAMVNAYICLINAGQYKLAEMLRVDFKKASGQDLAQDTNGVSY